MRFVNRVRGSGTRVWLDQRLKSLGVEAARIPGYEREVLTHTEVAAHILTGGADAGIAIRAVAERAGLGFVPLFTERFDLVFRADAEDERVARVLDSIRTARFRRRWPRSRDTTRSTAATRSRSPSRYQRGRSPALGSAASAAR